MATTTIDVSATVPQIAAAIGMALPEFADRAAATLDHAFGTYAKTPILATLVGYDL